MKLYRLIATSMTVYEGLTSSYVADNELHSSTDDQTFGPPLWSSLCLLRKSSSCRQPLGSSSSVLLINPGTRSSKLCSSPCSECQPPKLITSFHHCRLTLFAECTNLACSSHELLPSLPSARLTIGGGQQLCEACSTAGDLSTNQHFQASPAPSGSQWSHFRTEVFQFSHNTSRMK